MSWLKCVLLQVKQTIITSLKWWLVPLLLSLFMLQQKEITILSLRFVYIASEVFIVDTVL